MKDAKATEYPLPMAHPLYEDVPDLPAAEVEKMSTVPFRQVLGALLYLSTRTRPVIYTAV